MEAGQTVFNMKDNADKCYIILKGQVLVQIMDPSGDGGIKKPKPPVEVVEEQVKQVEEDDQTRNLTQAELN